MQQLELLPQRWNVTPAEEHLFRRWQARPGIIFDELPAELGMPTARVVTVVAAIWRRMR